MEKSKDTFPQTKKSILHDYQDVKVFQVSLHVKEYFGTIIKYPDGVSWKTSSHIKQDPLIQEYMLICQFGSLCMYKMKSLMIINC